MPRQYTVSFEKVSVSAAQDLIQITGSSKLARIRQISLSDVDPTAPSTNMQLALRCRILPATVSNGTGGTSATIGKTDLGDSAASFSALANNTGKATTTGTASVVLEDGCNIYGGYSKDFDPPIPIITGEAFVFELITTPAATVTLSGQVIVEEIGG